MSDHVEIMMMSVTKEIMENRPSADDPPAWVFEQAIRGLIDAGFVIVLKTFINEITNSNVRERTE